VKLRAIPGAISLAIAPPVAAKAEDYFRLPGFLSGVSACAASETAPSAPVAVAFRPSTTFDAMDGLPLADFEPDRDCPAIDFGADADLAAGSLADADFLWTAGFFP
jgi:hypothetical protein